MFIPSLKLKHKILTELDHKISFQEDKVFSIPDCLIDIYYDEKDILDELLSWITLCNQNYNLNNKIDIGKFKGIFPCEIITPSIETYITSSFNQTYEMPIGSELTKVKFSVDYINEKDSFLDWFKDDNYNINGEKLCQQVNL